MGGSREDRKRQKKKRKKSKKSKMSSSDLSDSESAKEGNVSIRCSCLIWTYLKLL